MPNTIQSSLAVADIGQFTSRTVTQFFGYFSAVLRTDIIFSTLSFALPDMVSPTPVYPSYRITDGDYSSFDKMKTSIIDHFGTSLNRNPTITIFRVVVSAPNDEVDSLILKSLVLQLPRVTIRVQTTQQGAVSGTLPSTILAGLSNQEFFKWYARQTRCGEPSGPSELTFAFKDMVKPKINTIQRGNEEHFQYLLADILPQCRITASNVPGLSEFCILITVPN